MTHVAIVASIEELEEIRRASGALDRVILNPMGPGSGDALLKTAVLKGHRGHWVRDLGAAVRASRASSHKESGVGTSRSPLDPLVDPVRRSTVRRALRDQLEEAERLGYEHRYQEAVEACWAAGRASQQLMSPQAGAVALSRAARWLRRNGDTKRAATTSKAAWVGGVSYSANSTWVHDELVFLAEVALEIGRDGGVFDNHDHTEYAASLHRLAVMVREHSSTPEAEALAMRADDLALRIAYELMHSGRSA